MVYVLTSEISVMPGVQVSHNVCLVKTRGDLLIKLNNFTTDSLLPRTDGSVPETCLFLHIDRLNLVTCLIDNLIYINKSPLIGA